jgi:hypothetical protein
LESSENGVVKAFSEICGGMAMRPQYNFEYNGAFAEGTLPNGTRFLIDADVVDDVSKYFWRIDKDGYVVAASEKKTTKFLHRIILNAPDGVIVDHINRIKTDNRRENLRMVTNTQSACNRPLQKNSMTGFAGVCWDSSNNYYKSRIGFFNRRLTLGCYKDTVQAAAAYNIAAAYLFGEYAGHMNDVPEPSAEFKKHIEEKCEKFKRKLGADDEWHGTVQIEETSAATTRARDEKPLRLPTKYPKAKPA